VVDAADIYDDLDNDVVVDMAKKSDMYNVVDDDVDAHVDIDKSMTWPITMTWTMMLQLTSSPKPIFLMDQYQK
jgi:hypothetical protein